MLTFYLGTHRPNWLRLTDVPLFVSAVQLRRYRRLPKAKGRVAFDSGGFTELHRHGRWTVDDRQLADEVDGWAEDAGMPDFVPCRDWMCEPFMLAKTGKTIKDHQALTIESYANLRAIAPHIPWMPVLQGWHAPDYLDHLDQYRAAGFHLQLWPRVGIGSICRRQATSQAARIVQAIAMEGIRVHAFGVKSDGIRLFGDWVASADSMAWSFVARRRPVLLEGCTTHKNCANCLKWALEWHRTRISEIARRDPDCIFGGVA